MVGEGFEDWDADFLDQLIQVEELALSATQHQHRPPQPQQLQFYPPPNHNANIISYSPPRELSQRPITDCSRNRSSNNCIFVNSANNQSEIDILKKELGRVSKQLTDLEQECSELRKERDKTEKQLKSVFSHTETKYSKVQCLNDTNLESEVHSQEFPRKSPHSLNQTTLNELAASRPITVSYAKGVQTENTRDCSQSNVNGDSSTRFNLSNKLLAIWGPPTCQRLGRNLVSKLFVVCSTDFHILFGFLNMNMPKNKMAALKDECFSNGALRDNFQSVCSSEAAKVSRFYTVLTKVSNGMVQLQTFFEALLDLCNLPNVVIAHRSLCILHVVLDHILGLERKPEIRDNVMVEGCSSTNNVVDLCEAVCPFSMGGTYRAGHILPETMPIDAKILCRKTVCSHSIEMPLSFIDWGSLFELMHQISIRNTEEHIRYEAVSVMNVVLMKSNSYLERENFGPMVFQCVSKLLRKEAGSRVQKEAVHLLYILLNCPKQWVTFCSGCKKDIQSSGATHDANNSLAYEELNIILDGLAECLAGSENDIQDLILRRNAIMLLAFLASSGDSGLEIVLSHLLSKRTKFLVLILQMLVSETDTEAAESIEPLEVHKERTLLIREALIFLNRLVSNPAYSSTALRVLTSTRNVAGLTVDIADRLSHKGRRVWQADSITRKMRESEIVDLAWVFRKRVYAFLGDSIL